jgi:hypothetical protein
MRLIGSTPPEEVPGHPELKQAWEEAVGAFQAIENLAYANVLDTMGFILLLRRHYADAARLFVWSLETSPNSPARNHLALLYMVGSPNYFRADVLLKATLADAREWETSNESRFARWNLQRIEENREKQIGENLIYLFTRPPHETRDVIRGEPSSEFVKTTLNIKWLYMPAFAFMHECKETLQQAFATDLVQPRATLREAIQQSGVLDIQGWVQAKELAP